MKRVLSVSLGSSRRDKDVEVEFLGERFHLSRQGTDGSLEKAREMISARDGEVDAFGLGGIDLYLWTLKKRYTIQDALKLKRAAKKTPVLDGSFLKHTLERRVVRKLSRQDGMLSKGTKVLMVSGVDRIGMAEALHNLGAELVFGDLMFGLGINIPLKSLKAINNAGNLLCPIVTRLPFKLVYPTGEKQTKSGNPAYHRWFEWADWIAGDFHYIKRFRPQDMTGKTILTNTTTEEDEAELKQDGLKRLITSTPVLEGRSFGTNLMEAMIVALKGATEDQYSPEFFESALNELDFEPAVRGLN